MKKNTKVILTTQITIPPSGNRLRAVVLNPGDVLRCTEGKLFKVPHVSIEIELEPSDYRQKRK